MKNKKLLTLLSLTLGLLYSTVFNAQTPVAVGKGSYASFPPPEELEFTWEGKTTYDDYNFVYNNPIYVKPGETRPIPTNDWWTNVLVSKYGGLLYAYPLVMQPLVNGLQIQYPNSFVPDGTNLDRGQGLVVKAAGYESDNALASNWSDWLFEMEMPDASLNANMKVTMGHGIPFTWIETTGINPEISAAGGATYLTAAGTPVTFPVASGGSFILSSEGKLFGIHMGNGVTAEIQGQQFVTIDLGASYALSSIKLNWETAFASGYTIKTSTDNINWTTQQTITNGDGNIDNLTLTGSGRWVQILLNQKGSIYGYSLYEVEVMSGATNVALNKPVIASSTQVGFDANLLNDGNTGTRWSNDATAQPALVFNMNKGANYIVVSALTTAADLTTYDQYAHNKPTDSKVTYNYDVNGGKVNTTWDITTTNLKGGAAGNTIQGFLPHQYKNTVSSNVTFTNNNYVTSRGSMKTAIGKSFTFAYKFGGILPSFNSPYKNSADESPYSSDVMYQLLTNFAAAKTSYGADTYWGGKDLVNLAKYTLMAKELNHQSYETLKARTKAALVDWLTYTQGESSHYFARYDRWKAIIGFDQSYGSAQFTDNHFHYGYLIHAAALYGMIDKTFLTDYGDMLKIVAQQYANWKRDDTFLPYFRTLDIWMGHSYAGGTSSGGGNNQESTSEAMQSWVGLYLLGDLLQDNAMRDAGAFGYTSESAATLEYWFDWDMQNLPDAYPHNMVGILWGGGYSYGTFFSASPVHIHGIQYLPMCPGFKYLAKNPTWAAREYNDMMTEARAADGYQDEIAFGDDWAHVALGFRSLFDPQYVTKFFQDNLALDVANPRYIMDYEVSGMSYYYAHSIQNLGKFSTNLYTNFPSSSVFETATGEFSRAVVFNSTNAAKTCNVYDASGGVAATFNVPANTLVTYPELPNTGKTPTSCYALMSSATSTTNNSSINAAFDANMGTRWSSATTGAETINLDLGLVCNISEVKVSWEVASAKSYVLQGSVEGTTWTNIKSYSNMVQGDRTDIINQLETGYRYLRFNLTEAASPWPYSIYEIAICGSVGNSTPVIGVQVPAKIEAESYVAMSGIQTEATGDTNGDISVGWIDDTDYLEYDINVPISGTYPLTYRVASIPGGGNILFQLDGATLQTTAVAATGGWQTWQTLSTSVDLTAGNHKLRLLAQPGGYNLNWFEIAAPNTQRLGLKDENTQNKQAANNTLLFYPNPASDKITIELESASLCQIDIYNVSAYKVYSQVLSQDIHTQVIKVSDWATGVYTVKATTSENATIVKQFIVK
jgi:endoglucanase Acf2